MSLEGQKGLQTPESSTGENASSESHLISEEASQAHGGGDSTANLLADPENIVTETTGAEASLSESTQEMSLEGQQGLQTPHDSTEGNTSSGSQLLSGEVLQTQGGSDSMSKSLESPEDISKKATGAKASISESTPEMSLEGQQGLQTPHDRMEENTSSGSQLLSKEVSQAVGGGDSTSKSLSPENISTEATDSEPSTSEPAQLLRMPVPNLTLDSYLAGLKAVLSDEEFEKARQLVEQFRVHPGASILAQLEAFAEKVNWEIFLEELQASEDSMKESTSPESNLLSEEASEVQGGGDRTSKSLVGTEKIATEEAGKEGSLSKSAQEMSPEEQKVLQTPEGSTDESTISGSFLPSEASSAQGGDDRRSKFLGGPENIMTEETDRKAPPFESAQKPSSQSSRHKPVTVSHSADSQSGADNTSGDASELPSRMDVDGNVLDNRSPTESSRSGQVSETDISSPGISEARDPGVICEGNGRFLPRNIDSKNPSRELPVSEESVEEQPEVLMEPQMEPPPEPPSEPPSGPPSGPPTEPSTQPPTEPSMQPATESESLHIPPAFQADIPVYFTRRTFCWFICIIFSVIGSILTVIALLSYYFS